MSSDRQPSHSSRRDRYGASNASASSRKEPPRSVHSGDGWSTSRRPGINIDSRNASPRSMSASKTTTASSTHKHSAEGVRASFEGRNPEVRAKASSMGTNPEVRTKTSSMGTMPEVRTQAFSMGTKPEVRAKAFSMSTNPEIGAKASSADKNHEVKAKASSKGTNPEVRAKASSTGTNPEIGAKGPSSSKDAGFGAKAPSRSEETGGSIRAPCRASEGADSKEIHLRRLLNGPSPEELEFWCAALSAKLFKSRAGQAGRGEAGLGGQAGSRSARTRKAHPSQQAERHKAAFRRKARDEREVSGSRTRQPGNARGSAETSINRHTSRRPLHSRDEARSDWRRTARVPAGSGVSTSLPPTSGKKVLCSVCKIYYSRNYFKLHILDDHGIRKHPCRHCGQHFIQKCDLKKHHVKGRCLKNRVKALSGKEPQKTWLDKMMRSQVKQIMSSRYGQAGDHSRSQ